MIVVFSRRRTKSALQLHDVYDLLNSSSRPSPGYRETEPSLFPSYTEAHSSLSMRCNPLAVSTIPLIWPGCSAKAASSNSLCISPLPKYPKSPLFLAELQSLSLMASSPRDTTPLLIFCSWPLMITMASSLDRVISLSRQLAGRRLSRCFTNR